MLGFAKLSMQAYNFAMRLTIPTGNMTKSSKISINFKISSFKFGS